MGTTPYRTGGLSVPSSIPNDGRWVSSPWQRVTADWSVSTDRGLCFIQTLITDQDVQIARASLYQVRQAASALILRCAVNSDSRGGIVSNIGEFRSMIIDATSDHLHVWILVLTSEQVVIISSLLCWASTNPTCSAEAPSGWLNGARAETFLVACQPINNNESLDHEVIQAFK